MSGLAIAALMPSSACIIPDYCIVHSWLGNNWCATMEGAMKWPAGHPELAEPLLSDEFEVPTGCRCVNDAEHAILEDELPIEAHELLRAEIEALTREKCLVLGLGFANNCLQEEVEGAPIINSPLPREGVYGPCIADCEYIGPAPPGKSCPDDPDPFECEGIVLDGEDDEAAEDCPIGAEDCPCTAGGACDSNLDCVDGMCLPFPDGEEMDDGSDEGPILGCPEGVCSPERELGSW